MLINKKRLGEITELLKDTQLPACAEHTALIELVSEFTRLRQLSIQFLRAVQKRKVCWGDEWCVELADVLGITL